MKIGNIDLPNPVALAPMAGVTDLPFRQLCRQLGAGYVVGEMLASDPSLRNSAKSRLRGVHLEEPIPRAIQIVGWDPATLAEAARYNADQGASIIDINMGCPAKKVCQRFAGSALLGDEALVRNILRAVVSAVAVPVTLKIRTGLTPTTRNGVAIARIAEQEGISALAVHGRTRQCKYQGEVEYQTIREICQAVTLPVFVNGDISGYAEASQIKEFTGAAGIMIGRAAHGAPWYPGQLAKYLNSGIVPQPLSILRQGQIVLSHLDRIHSFYGPVRGVGIARKHIKWYTQLHPNSASFRASFNAADCVSTQLKLTSVYYDQLGEQLDHSSGNQLGVHNSQEKSWQKNQTPIRIPVPMAKETNLPIQCASQSAATLAT